MTDLLKIQVLSGAIKDIVKIQSEKDREDLADYVATITGTHVEDFTS